MECTALLECIYYCINNTVAWIMAGAISEQHDVCCVWRALLYDIVYRRVLHVYNNVNGESCVWSVWCRIYQTLTTCIYY